MYIKNPHKKVSYSFRIKPDTLEDLKLYAEANKSSIPEILNILITDKLDGVTLTNDYLKDFKSRNITVPSLQDIYDNTNTVEMYEELDLLNPFLNGTTYEVKQIPNNLDIWDNTDNLLNNHGYTSHNYPKYIHEGIEVVLAPELITTEILEKYNNTELQLILPFCLLFIHFKVNFDNDLTISLLTHREAVNKVKETNDFTLMEKINLFKIHTDEVIQKILNEVETPGQYSTEEILILLQDKLQRLAMEVNTSNIICKDTKKTVDGKEVGVLDDDNQVIDIVKENQDLKIRVLDLETKFLEINKILKRLEDFNAREQTWEDIAKDSKDE